MFVLRQKISIEQCVCADVKSIADVIKKNFNLKSVFMLDDEQGMNFFIDKAFLSF